MMIDVISMNNIINLGFLGVKMMELMSSNFDFDVWRIYW